MKNRMPHHYGLLIIALCAVFIVWLSGFAPQAFAADIKQTASADYELTDFSMRAFERIPVLHNGRLKPLKRFAAQQARQITGSETPLSYSAAEWLAIVIFDPSGAAEIPFIEVRGEALQRQFGLEQFTAQKPRSHFSLTEMFDGVRYSATQIPALLALDADTLSAGQRDFLRIHENILQLTALMRSLSLILPLDVDVPQEFQSLLPDDTPPYYLALAHLETRLLERAEAIVARRGDDPQRYTLEEQRLTTLAFQLEALRKAAEGNSAFAIVPVSWSGSASTAAAAHGITALDWRAPWDLIQSGLGSPDSAQYLSIWAEMAAAFRAQDKAAWQTASQSALNAATSKGNIRQSAFALEILYSDIHPYQWAQGFYALALMLLVFAALIQGNQNRKEKRDIFSSRITAAAVLIGILAVLMHGFGLAARVIILERPPTGTLYETVLFVSLICTLSALSAYFISRAAIIFSAGLAAALGLLLIAPAIIGEGKNFEVLAAVLNTNFWLATHVTIITAGYALCLIVSGMAHFYMLMRLWREKSDRLLVGLYKSVHRVSLIALLLTAIGTILGGIWADQSWGRFWGWDPKENGALLIVLWLIWLQHGRLSGHIRDLPFMAGIAFLSVIVALAWFGVNLLGVGLHSYGFISGIAWGLLIFCSAETLIISVLWALTRYQDKIFGLVRAVKKTSNKEQ
jgi:ABC-type transport system involved in cytochrome c biogenesis permease subunit